MTNLFVYAVIIASAIFHEYGHAWMAYQLGDDTAKNEGRLTLNPFKHIEMLGTVIIPLFLMLTSGIFIGWAKPVPYNPYNLRDQKYGSLKVAIAGPVANIIIALIFGLLLRFLAAPLILGNLVNPLFIELIQEVVYINITLALFNLIPFPPLDGSKVAADLWPRYWRTFQYFGMAGIFLALLVSFVIISPLARLIFRLITGFGLF